MRVCKAASSLQISTIFSSWCQPCSLKSLISSSASSCFCLIVLLKQELPSKSAAYLLYDNIPQPVSLRKKSCIRRIMFLLFKLIQLLFIVMGEKPTFSKTGVLLKHAPRLQFQKARQILPFFSLKVSINFLITSVFI